MIAALVLASMSVRDSVGTYVRQQMAAWHVPGVAVGVVQNGKVVLASGFGFANIETGATVSANSAFEVLSVGKEFTATAVLMLVDQGKIELESKISKYLPDLPTAWQQVTVRQLLSHTSGLPDYTDAPGFFQNAAAEATPDELLDPIRDRPLQFTPGARFRYSNTNYFLLGKLISVVSGEPYEAYMSRHVFVPLGMRATRMDDLRDVIPGRVAGYHWIGKDADRMPAFVSGFHGVRNVLQNAVAVSPSRKWAAGGFITTLNDLLRWDSSKLLRPETRRLMVTPSPSTAGPAPYGLGEELHTVRGHPVVGHQGGGLAFNATIARYTRDGVTVIVLCNQTSAPSEAMANHIAALYIPSLAPEKAILDADLALTGRLRRVLLDAAEGKVDESFFAESASNTVAFVKATGPRFLGGLGALKSFELLSRRKEGELGVYRYRAIYDSVTLIWEFKLDAQQRIVSLDPEQ